MRFSEPFFPIFNFGNYLHSFQEAKGKSSSNEKRMSFKWPSSRTLTSSYMCFHHSEEIYRVYFPSSYNCKTSHLTLRHPHFILSQTPFSQQDSLTASFSHAVLQPCCPVPIASSETDHVSRWEISRACHIHSWTVTVLSTPTLDAMRFASWKKRKKNIYAVGFWYPPEKAIAGFISTEIQAFKWRSELEAYSLPVLGDWPSGRPWAPPQADP